MPTSEAVAFAKSAIGFPTARTVKTIAAAVTTKILVLRFRDEIAALYQTFPVAGGSHSSAGSERKRGTGSSEAKPSFVAIDGVKRSPRSSKSNASTIFLRCGVSLVFRAIVMPLRYNATIGHHGIGASTRAIP